MRTLRRLLIVTVILSLLAFALYLGYRTLVGWPATPMTLAEAESLFSTAVKPGNSVEDVKNWLASQAIPHSSKAKNIFHDVHYEFVQPPESGSWQDATGNRTAADRAGLQNENVHSMIRVRYPEADRFPLDSWTAISVYIFCDAQGRVIRHWIHEDEFGPGGTPKKGNLPRFG